MPRLPQRSTLSVLLFYCGMPRCHLMLMVPLDLQLFQYLAAYASLLAAHTVLTADTILRLALHSLSLPLFHYGLHIRVLNTLYIQRLSL